MHEQALAQLLHGVVEEAAGRVEASQRAAKLRRVQLLEARDRAVVAEGARASEMEVFGMEAREPLPDVGLSPRVRGDMGPERVLFERVRRGSGTGHTGLDGCDRGRVGVPSGERGVRCRRKGRQGLQERGRGTSSAHRSDRMPCPGRAGSEVVRNCSRDDHLDGQADRARRKWSLRGAGGKSTPRAFTPSALEGPRGPGTAGETRRALARRIHVLETRHSSARSRVHVERRRKARSRRVDSVAFAGGLARELETNGGAHPESVQGRFATARGAHDTHQVYAMTPRIHSVRTSHGRTLVGVIALCAATAAVAVETKPEKIAVHPLVVLGAGPKEQQEFQKLLEDELAKVGEDVDIVPHERVAEYLATQPRKSCLDDDDCLAKLARAVGAAKTLRVSIAPYAQKLIASARIVGANGLQLQAIGNKEYPRRQTVHETVSEGLERLLTVELAFGPAPLEPPEPRIIMKAEPWRRPAAIATATAGGAALVSGLLFRFLAQRAHDAAELGGEYGESGYLGFDQNESVADLRGIAYRDNAIALTSLGIAAGCGAASLFLFLTSRTDEPAAPQADIWIHPQGAGATLTFSLP
jgi:hypothetical protein